MATAWETSRLAVLSSKNSSTVIPQTFLVRLLNNGLTVRRTGLTLRSCALRRKQRNLRRTCYLDVAHTGVGTLQ